VRLLSAGVSSSSNQACTFLPVVGLTLLLLLTLPITIAISLQLRQPGSPPRFFAQAGAFNMR
jgi:hypothetical protein